MQKKKIDNYTIFLDKKLGQGSFGKVYVGEQDKTHLKVAVKMLDKNLIDKDPYIKQALMSQIQILKSLKSQNIVRLEDVMESANFYYLLQQFCDGGDVRGLIKKKGKLPESQAIQMLKQICNGFVQLLKEGIIHRDLKPQNLLLNKGQIKICDFGFSKKIHSKKFKNKSMVGTPLYMSLQILKGEQYSSKCDIWALGFIFFQLLNGYTPWTANSEFELIKNIETKPLKFLVDLSATTKDFLTKCLKPTEKSRISWDQLLRHEIFNGHFSQYTQQQHQFQNKLKYLMGELRRKINQQNININRLFKDMGYNNQTQLNFEDFQKFLKTIDSTLTQQQQRYIFQKLDTDQSDSISCKQLQNEMIKNNISTTIGKKIMSTLSLHEEEEINQQQFKLKSIIQAKLINVFLKLNEKITKLKIKLSQVFDAYDINRDGDMTIKQFSRVIKKLDESFTNEQLEISFGLVDFDNNKSISFEQFNKYFCKSVGKPYNNYMNQKGSVSK